MISTPSSQEKDPSTGTPYPVPCLKAFPHFMGFQNLSILNHLSQARRGDNPMKEHVSHTEQLLWSLRIVPNRYS